MAGNLLHVGATVVCPHTGGVNPRPARQNVLVAGQAVTTVADAHLVTACPFTAGNKPQPCLTVDWTRPATRIQVNGSPALLQSSTGQCVSGEGVRQGPPQVVAVQQRVVGQ